MKKLFTVALISLVVLLTVNSVQAMTFTFTDGKNYWDTWANGTADDNKDSIGRPDFIGGGGTIDDGILTNLYFTYTGSMDKLELGDVFIDATSDGYWDYVLNNGSVYSLADGSLSATKGVNDEAYKNSDDSGWNGDNSGWGSSDYRNDHPYAVTDDYLNTSGTNIGAYSLLASAGIFTFNISSEELGFNLNEYTLSVAQNCANDVLTTTPEPATMLLLGSGLIGLAGLRRKRFLKK